MKDDNDGNRARILATVTDLPGLNIQEIAQEVDLARTSVVYHMRQLVREKAVATQRQGHHLLHFPASMPEVEQAALTALRVPSLRGIIEKVFFEPKISRHDLEDQLFMSARTLRRALTRLQKDQLAAVHKSAGTGSPFIELNPLLRTLLGRQRELLDPHRPPLDRPKGVKAWLWLFPQAWRTLVSPW